MNFAHHEKIGDDKCISIVSPLGNKNNDDEKGEDEKKKTDKKTDEDEADECGVCGETEEEAEARKVAGYKGVKKPSKQAVDNHRLTHLPYESWCPDCVMGRGLGARHVNSTDRREELRTPTIAADYCFMGDDQEEQKLTILVARDSKTGSACSTVVENEGGSCAWGVKRVTNFVDGLGYGKVMFKSDNENSITDVWNAVRIARTAPTIPENSPKGESQANGIAERAVQDIEGLLRTFKSALERRIGVRIKPSDSIMPWMVEHCSTLVNRCRIGVDGMTAYERITGKPNRKKMCEFGETVMYMGVKSKNEKSNKLNPKFEYGIWLGVHGRSSEDIIGTEQGVLRASAIKRVPDDERWSSERVLQLKGVPWDAREEEKVPQGDEREAADKDRVEEEDMPQAQVKRFYIRKEDIIKYGYTAACPGCTAIRNNKRAFAHNDKCRDAMLEKMRKDKEDGKRVAADKGKLDEHFARQVEQEAKKKDSDKDEGDKGDGGEKSDRRGEPEDGDQEAANPKKKRNTAQIGGSSGSSVDHKKTSRDTRCEDEDDEATAQKKRRLEAEAGDCILVTAECITEGRKKGSESVWKRSDPHLRRPTLSDRGRCPTRGRRVDSLRNDPERSEDIANRSDKVKTSLLDLTSEAEEKKARDLGSERWTRRIMKTIRKLKPDAVIGGGSDVLKDDWAKIYKEQAKMQRYYIHNCGGAGGPVLSALTSERNTYFDMKAKRRMTIESNMEKVNDAFAGKRVHDPCQKIRNRIVYQHRCDLDAGKIMSMDVEGKVWDDANGGWLDEENVKKA